MGQVGGDFSNYRDWFRLDDEDIHFRMVQDRPIRRVAGLARKALEKSCRRWQPLPLRRRLFLASRFLPVSHEDLRGADLVFSHVLFPSGVPAGVPVVWNSQGISPDAYYERTNGGRWDVREVANLYGILGRRAAALVVSSHVCARNVERWRPELSGKIHVVPAAVFAEKAAPEKPSVKDGQVRFLFVGVDALRKGLPETVEAFARLRQIATNVRLDVVSRPPEDLAERIRRQECVRLWPPLSRERTASLMEEADVYVIPSRADTYALAAVEAMARGCAIVTSDIDPLPEVAPDGVVGFSVPVGDALALKEKLHLLVTRKDLLREFQRNALRQYDANHRPEYVKQKLMAVFEDVIRRQLGPKEAANV
jgi:glycosyltransferase involved in cell wall biosynthesis